MTSIEILRLHAFELLVSEAHRNLEGELNEQYVSPDDRQVSHRILEFADKKVATLHYCINYMQKAEGLLKGAKERV